MVANGFEGVPWFVGGGAKHSAEIARLAAFLGGAGPNEGIAASGDLKVSQSGTADGNVHMAIGACSVLNRSSNALSQKYICRATQVSDIPIASTGGAGRSDLVVVSVEDPQYPPFSSSGWTTTQIENGPYVFPRVLSGVPNTAKTPRDAGATYNNRSMLAIARIDIPAGTTNITSSMIKDLRRLQSPQETTKRSLQPGPASPQFMAVGDTGAYKDFPTNTFQVEVPPWATDAAVTITINTVASDAASDYVPRIYFGGLTALSGAWDYNGNGGTSVGYWEKLTFPMYAEFDVRSLQGQTVTCKPQGIRIFPGNTGQILVDAYAQIAFEVAFSQRAL